MYCKVLDGQVVKYPYYIEDLVLDNPNVSFPANENGLTLSDDEYKAWGMFRVHPTDPGCDPVTHSFVEGQPELRDGSWCQSWVITENSPELVVSNKLRLADFIGFYDALISSPVYQEIRNQALTNWPLLLACTEFIAAFTDAKAGRPNQSAIQSCITNVVGQATLEQAQIDFLQSLLDEYRLSAVFSLG